MRAEAVSNGGPSAYRPNTLPLGQTGSHAPAVNFDHYKSDVTSHKW